MANMKKKRQRHEKTKWDDNDSQRGKISDPPLYLPKYTDSPLFKQLQRALKRTRNK